MFTLISLFSEQPNDDIPKGLVVGCAVVIDLVLFYIFF